MPGKKAPEAVRREQILQAALRVALRDRLDRLTIRSVAAEAGISPGLVFFHFTNKATLLVALLEWLLEVTVVAEVGADILAHPTPADRLLALLGQEFERLLVKRERLELFFDYWVLGDRSPEIRALIRGALDRYRETFQPFTTAIISADPVRFAGVNPDGLTLLVISVIQGCAIQAIKNPEHFELDLIMATVRELVV